MFVNLKKGVIALLCAMLCLTFTKGSANDGCNPCPSYDSCSFSPCDFDFGLGIFYDQKSEHFLPYITVLYKCFTLGFGVNGRTIEFENDRGDDDDTSIVFYAGHAGFRFCLCPCVYFTVGGSGSWSSVNHGHGVRHPWVAGPYVGLDYHMTSCLLLTAQILPYARHRFFTGEFENQYFQQGMIGVSYIF